MSVGWGTIYLGPRIDRKLLRLDSGNTSDYVNKMSKIRVYQYGLKAPTQNADLVREQMILAHRYRNTLTEIERGRRSAIRDFTAL
jgi:hypothetical protein